MGVRHAALSLWSVIGIGKSLETGLKKIDGIRSLLAYAVEHPSHRRRTPMDVKGLADAWVAVIRVLGTAHDKDALDKAEFEMDRLLKPILVAPVKQIREFYALLCKRLQEDPSIPLFIWTAFNAWHEVIVKRAPDQEVMELKETLAREVAALVEKDIVPDLQEALVGALKWRCQEDLEKVRAAVKAGARPRVKGRESCLFLVVGEEKDAPMVML